MRVRLYSDDFELTGYENIKVLSYADLDQLSKYDQGELDELVVDNVLEYLPIQHVEDTLKSLTKFVSKTGKFIVVGSDVYEAAKAFTGYMIDIVEFNKTIYGNNPDVPKRVGFSTPSISNYLEQHAGMKILKKRINGYTYTIEATR